jgi:hypothetical protein
MSKLASRVLTLPLTLFCCLLSTTQTSPKKDAADQDFSKESVVVEQPKTKVVFQNDGTYVGEQYVRARIQSDAGVRQYGVITLPYQASDGHLEVQGVRVIKPNGTVVVTDLNSVQDETSEISRQAPTYSDLREKHVPVKGLEPGDELEYSTRLVVDKPLIPGQIFLGAHFVNNLVNLDDESEISVPRTREIEVKSQESQPTIHEDGDRRIYSWKTSNFESRSPEKVMDAQRYAAMRGLLPPPDVLLSSFHSWEEVGRWYDDLQREKIQPSPEVKAKAEELTNGLTDEMAKIRAIYNYVSLRYRYISIGFGVGRYQPHAAAEIFGAQFGDCKDKLTLLAAMLNAVGIRAFPALINSQMTIVTDVPSPGQFNHVITAVLRGNSVVWMDSTPELTPMGYLVPQLRAKPALIIEPGKVEFQTTPTDSQFVNLDTTKVTATLGVDGTLQAHSESRFRGDSEPYFRGIFRRVPESQWKDYGQQSFYGGLLGGTVTNIQVSSPEKTDEPFNLDYDYTIRDFSGGENHRFVVPLSFSNIPPIRDQDLQRTTPFWLGPVGETIYESRIELPKGRSASQPVPLDLKESFAEFHGETDVDGNVLTTKRRLLLKVNAIAPDQLKSYKEFQKAVSDNHALYIFLHVPADVSTSGPVSTPSQGLARALELARQSLIQLPGSSNSEVSGSGTMRPQLGENCKLSLPTIRTSGQISRRGSTTLRQRRTLYAFRGVGLSQLKPSIQTSRSLQPALKFHTPV